jgi:RNA polymerase sigma-70 factor, ECF subfamily
MLRKPASKELAVRLQGNRDSVGQPEQWLQRALNGDREALGHLFASHTPQLYRVALRILGKPQDAEEALQDGFLNALRHLRDFECRSRFSTWLSSIVINASLMRLRKSRREVLTSFDQELERDKVAWADRIADPGPSPEELCVWKERLEIIEGILRSLPEALRSVLRLRGVQGISTQEAAEILGVKTGTVKSQLHRARLRLGMKICMAGPYRRTLQTSRRKLRAERQRHASRSIAALASPAA